MGSNILKTLVVLAALAVVLPLAAGDVDCSQHPPRVDPMGCCPLPNFVSEEIEEKCKQAGGMPPPPPQDDDENGSQHRHHKHHHNFCFPSCFLNETGILIDNELNEENLESYLNENLADTPDIIPIVKDSFVECYAKADEVMEKMHKHFENSKRGPPPHARGPPHGRCGPKAGFIMGCSMKNVFKQCPDTIWSGTDECNELREFFTECKPPHERDEV